MLVTIAIEGHEFVAKAGPIEKAGGHLDSFLLPFHGEAGEEFLAWY